MQESWGTCAVASLPRRPAALERRPNYAPKFHCLLLNEGIPLEHATIVFDAYLESLLKKIEKALLGFGLRVISAIVVCERRSLAPQVLYI